MNAALWWPERALQPGGFPATLRQDAMPTGRIVKFLVDKAMMFAHRACLSVGVGEVVRGDYGAPSGNRKSARNNWLDRSLVRVLVHSS